jgi:hypothetical protein
VVRLSEGLLLEHVGDEEDGLRLVGMLPEQLYKASSVILPWLDVARIRLCPLRVVLRDEQQWHSYVMSSGLHALYLLLGVNCCWVLRSVLIAAGYCDIRLAWKLCRRAMLALGIQRTIDHLAGLALHLFHPLIGPLKVVKQPLAAAWAAKDAGHHLVVFVHGVLGF